LANKERGPNGVLCRIWSWPKIGFPLGDRHRRRRAKENVRRRKDEWERQNWLRFSSRRKNRGYIEWSKPNNMGAFLMVFVKEAQREFKFKPE
jgi:hypothetical protein